MGVYLNIFFWLQVSIVVSQGDDLVLKLLLNKLHESQKPTNILSEEKVSNMMDLVQILKMAVDKNVAEEEAVNEDDKIGDLRSLSAELAQIETDFERKLALQRKPKVKIIEYLGESKSFYPQPQNYFHSLNVLHDFFEAGRKRQWKRRMQV